MPNTIPIGPPAPALVPGGATIAEGGTAPPTDAPPPAPESVAAAVEAETPLGVEPAGEDPGLLPTILMGVAAFALFSVVLRGYLRRSRERSEASGVEAGERIAAIREAAAAREAPGQSAAETVDLISSLVAQLDARAVRLERLVDHAEAAISRLERAQGLMPLDEEARAEAPRVDRTARPHEGLSNIDPMHRRVYELADAGREPVAIAQELGQPTGQVELILALRRRA